MKNRLNKKRKFIITGGLGFIGSHFVDLLLKNGHQVINIDKVSYASNTLDIKNKNYSFIKEDISTIKTLPNADFIVNFAAESHVDNSIANSQEFIQSNIVGVYNLLEILKNKKIENMKKAWEFEYPTFIQISTDEVFGDIEEGFFDIDDRHKPSNPYAASKSAGEQLLTAWGRTYGIPYLITRTTNNYGTRQFPEKLIPKVITCLLSGEKIPVHGSGEYVRNWIHVEDNVRAIYKVINDGELSSSYHISSEEEYSVKEIIEVIATYFDKKFDDVVSFNSDRSGADVRYALNSDETKKLGWSTSKTLKSSIPELIEFYRKKEK